MMLKQNRGEADPQAGFTTFVLQIEEGIQDWSIGLGYGFMDHPLTTRPVPSLTHIGQMAAEYRGEGAFHGTFLFLPRVGDNYILLFFILTNGGQGPNLAHHA
jgi:hypothetical protein